MDLQGAELLALKGLVPFDKSLKYIVVEACFNYLYDGCSTIKDVTIFLEKYNFYPKKMNGDDFQSQIYIQINILMIKEFMVRLYI